MMPSSPGAVLSSILPLSPGRMFTAEVRLTALMSSGAGTMLTSWALTGPTTAKSNSTARANN
jgi:hypothetical protein